MTRARRALAALALPVLLVARPAATTVRASGARREAVAGRGPGARRHGRTGAGRGDGTAGNRPRPASPSRPRRPTRATPSTRPARARAALQLRRHPGLRPGLAERRRRSRGSGTSRASRSAEPLAIAQVAIENRVINRRRGRPGDATATSRRPRAPTSRRSGTGSPAARWRSRPELQQAAADDDGATCGSAATGDAPEVHVGAYAPQIPTRSTRSSTSVGPTLGMKTDNALLDLDRTAARRCRSASRSSGSPATDASVQMLDVASRARPRHRARSRRRSSSAQRRASAVGTFNYTVLGGGRIAPEPVVGARRTSAPSRCRSSAASPATS